MSSSPPSLKRRLPTDTDGNDASGSDSDSPMDSADARTSSHAAFALPPAKRVDARRSLLSAAPAARPLTPDLPSHSYAQSHAQSDDPFAHHDDDNENGDGNGNDSLVAFQKVAIYNQMLEYKRSFSRAQDTIAILQTRSSAFDLDMALVNKLVFQLEDDLQSFLLQLDQLAPVADIDPSLYVPAINCTELLQRILADAGKPDNVSELLQVRWAAIQSLLSEIFKRVEMVLAFKESDINVKNISLISNATVDSLSAAKRSLSSQLITVQTKLDLSQKHVADLENFLDDTRTKLLSAEKKLDKAKREINLAQSMSVKKEEQKTGGAERNGDAQLVESKQFRDLNEEMELKNNLAELRLKEIEDQRLELLVVRKEIVHLKLSLQTASEDKILNSEPYRLLSEKVSLFQIKTEQASEKVTLLTKENESLSEGKSKAIDMLQTEVSTHIDKYKGELSKLEAEGTRLRSQRDALQQTLNNVNSEKGMGLLSLSNLKILADSRSDRVRTLEVEVTRLKQAIAAGTGDKVIVEILDSLKEKNDNELSAAAFPLSSSFVQDMRLKQENELLKTQLAELAKSDPALRLADALKETKMLKLQLETGEKGQNMLFQEIETLGEAWRALDAQVGLKTMDSVDKEEQMMRLVGEKTKLDHKCQLLQKQATTANNSSIAMRRQAEKHQDMIKKLEEREKALKEQIASLEKELRAANNLISVHERQSTESILKAKDLEARLGKTATKFEDLAPLLKEKIEALENATHAKRRLQEEVATSKKRIDQLSKHETPAETQGLLRELQNFRALIRCSACNTRTKSHLITKCMHTFCELCLDALIKSRQRKCPSCGLPFGKDDIKEFYL